MGKPNHLGGLPMLYLVVLRFQDLLLLGRIRTHRRHIRIFP